MSERSWRSLIELVPGAEESAPGDLLPPAGVPPVEILLPYRDAWHVLRICLDALAAFTPWPDLRLTLLDDASDAFTRERVAAFAAAHAGAMRIRVLRNETALGFVGNANRGLREAAAPFVVLLNSDTLVTPGWLARLVDTALGDARVAAAMPMSNEASLHSLALPMGWNVFQYAASLARTAKRTAYDAVTAAGFCLLIRRDALDDVGLFDTGFGLGYGEESDWCMRARSRGWRVVGVEDAFVHHRGKATFGDHKATTFFAGNYQRFMTRWGPAYSDAIGRHYDRDPLAPLRDAYVRMRPPEPPPLLRAFSDRVRSGGVAYATRETRNYLRDQGGARRLLEVLRRPWIGRPREAHPMPRGFQSARRPRVTYVLEKFSISGGVLSVVQLVNRLTLLGWDAKIATHHGHDQRHLRRYALYSEPYVFPDAESMIRHFPPSDVVVATLWSTVPKVHRIVTETLPGAVPWYFVQDDETRFFPESDARARQAVMDGYPLIPNRIVKSDWLAGVLAARGFESVKVPLGMDLDLFYAADPARPRTPSIVAMARPETPRRGFAELVATLRAFHALRPDVEIRLFGSTDLAAHGIDFPFVDLGLVPQERLRKVYGEAAVFLDTSRFQGFGRPALEAMACGCAAVLGRNGGVNEYARDGENCLLIDPSDRDASVAALTRIFADAELHARLAAAGLATAAAYDCDAEARATAALFARSLGIEGTG